MIIYNLKKKIKKRNFNQDNNDWEIYLYENFLIYSLTLFVLKQKILNDNQTIYSIEV